MASSSNSRCGMPLLKKDNQGNARFCTNKFKFITSDGKNCCGIHAKTLGIDTSANNNNNTAVCECSICLNDCSQSQLKTLPCEHQFHKKCVDKWLKKNNSCPLCRRVVVPRPTPAPDPDAQLRSLIQTMLVTLVQQGVEPHRLSAAILYYRDNAATPDDLRSVNSFLTSMARSIGIETV